MAIGTTIDGLNAVTSLTTNDEMPVWDKEASGEPTKKITAQNMAASVKSLASLPNTTEMNAAIQQSTANIVHFFTLTGQMLPDNSVKTYELASFLPSGYTLWSVIVTILSGNDIYQLPYIDGSGKSTYVQRVNGTTITISNTVSGWPTNAYIYVTAFLKRN